MDPIIISAIISGVVALTGTILNVAETHEINRENIALQEKANATNLDIAKNGISYKVADAEKNGFSPLAALGAQGIQ